MGRLIAWALTAAFTFASSIGAQEEGAQDAEALRLGEILAEASRASTPDAAARELVSLGAGAGAALLAALAEGAVPTTTGPRMLEEHERAVLLEGARLLGRRAFAPLWAEAAAAEDASRRRAALDLIGATGTASDLRFATLAARSDVPGAAPEVRLLAALERTTSAILARDPAALSSVQSLIRSSPVAIACPLVHAVGSLESHAALAVLADSLGWQEALDLPVLAELERVARKLSPPFDAVVCERVRGLARHSDRQFRRNAVMALAELEDPRAVPQLLALAAGDDETVSAAAFRALESIAGLKLPRRTSRWQSWFTAEVGWIRSRGPALRAMLAAGEPVEIVTALREMAGHRLDRLSLFEAALICLSHDDERVRAEACHTLGALHPELAAPRLQAALQDSSQIVVAAATEALRRAGRSNPQ